VRFVYFTHSLRSCWNHGNAHFLRGMLRALLAQGHEVCSFEPDIGWSMENLRREQGGDEALALFSSLFPDLAPRAHTLCGDMDAMLDGADVVLVHEWNEPALIAAIGERRRRGGRFVLLFHDTHHRAVTDPHAIGALDLNGYDGVLAFGATLADVYRRAGWGSRAFIWHEAADTRLFRPPAQEASRHGAVWIGNWGDDERSEELRSYLLHPARALGLQLDIYGVRYPKAALNDLKGAGACYRGWLPNAQAPEVFARHLLTVHVPRRTYAAQLRGIPTIRVFEALACGIPLVCAPWEDSESLFRAGRDFLLARTPDDMQMQMARLREDPDLRNAVAASGLETIQERHTCDHRAAELLRIVAEIAGTTQEQAA
jgi:spore maturation protein CgeB